jgi:uncharacterized protein (DUF1697 family)
MALVVFLRGVNVGGHRTFRPAALAAQLKHLDAVNIGAAGTFVIRTRITRARLRTELVRRLPFETTIAICDGRDVSTLIDSEPYRGERARPNVVRFISVLTEPPRLRPAIPIAFPPRGKWLVKILARNGCFIVGQYRRDMKTIGHLGGIDRLFGVPVTTRNWSTIASIGRVLAATTTARRKSSVDPAPSRSTCP